MIEGQQEVESTEATERSKEEVPPSRWPQPVPEEWKKVRKANTNEWFEQKKELLHR